MSKRFKEKDLKSSLERDVYKGLKALRHKNNFKIGYETDKLKYTIHRTYIPDFIIDFKDGHRIYIEAKGYMRAEDRAKLLAVKSQHPDKDIRIIFERDNKLNKKARMRYSDWAKRHGWNFSIRSIPKHWFERNKKEQQ